MYNHELAWAFAVQRLHYDTAGLRNFDDDDDDDNADDDEGVGIVETENKNRKTRNSGRVSWNDICSSFFSRW